MTDKWIVFDLIGVLAEPSWRDLVDRESVYEAKWRRFKTGDAPEDEFWTKALQSTYRSYLAFRPDRLALAREFAHRGYKLAIATNFSNDWLEFLLNTLSQEDRRLFSAFFVSSKEKVAKPAHEFFEKLKRIAPAGSLFVDDRWANCRAATEAGYKAIWAHPGASLKRELEASAA